MLPSLLSPRRVRILAWIAGVISLFTVLGFFVLPPLLKSELQKTLSAQLHRDVTIGAIAINPYTLTITVSKIDIKEPGGAHFVSLDELYANAELSSIFRLAPILKELRLTGPHISLAHIETGRYNFSDILDEILAKPGGGPTPRFALNNIQITKGRIDFDDKPAHAKHAITEIGLGIPFVSSIPSLTDIFVEPTLSAQVNGAPIEIKGKTKPFRQSLETEVAIDIDKFELPRLNDYLPPDLKVKIPAGRFDSKLAVKFLRHPDKPASLTVSGELSVSDLTLVESNGKPMLKLPRLALALADFEPLARKLKISKLSIDGADIRSRRDDAGQFNWLAVLPKAKPASTPAEPAAAFLLELDELSVTKARYSFDNDASATPWIGVTEGIDLSVKGYSSANTAPIKAEVLVSGLHAFKKAAKQDV